MFFCKNSENQDLFYPVTHFALRKKKIVATSVDLKLGGSGIVLVGVRGCHYYSNSNSN